MRRRRPILVLLALAAMAAVTLAQASTEPRAQVAAIAASGSFEISSAGDGRPIFTAGGIAPGESATGTVEIEDSGSAPVELTLRRGEVVDEPGLAGGLLSSRMRLTVTDVTDPAAPRTVYAGPLDSMPEVRAGNFAAGKARTYEFVATLPDGGEPSFQNAVQRASTTIAYSWVASEASAEDRGGERREGAGGTGGAQGRGDGGDRGEAARLKLVVPRIKSSLHRGRLTAWTNCSMPCRLRVRGRLRAKAPTGTRYVAGIHWTSTAIFTPGPHRVRLRIPHSMRAWIRATPGRERLRGRLRFTAVGRDGERAAVRKAVGTRKTIDQQLNFVVKRSIVRR